MTWNEVQALAHVCAISLDMLSMPPASLNVAVDEDLRHGKGQPRVGEHPPVAEHAQSADALARATSQPVHMCVCHDDR